MYGPTCILWANLTPFSLKLLEKAAAASYVQTTAFSTVVFTLQTVGLVASDSFAPFLEREAPAVAELANVLQSMLNPDKNAPEKCLFPPTLTSKFVVDAVLPPVLTLAVLAAVGASWHFAALSLGVRPCCDAKRAAADRVTAGLQRRKLTQPTEQDAAGPLLKGTWAGVRRRPAAGGPDEAAAETRRGRGPKRTVALDECERDQIWLDPHTVAAAGARDFEQNDDRQLRRMLRGYGVSTHGTEPRRELLHAVRFHLSCDDTMFDNARMPSRLHAYQIVHAMMHVFVYYFAPVTRALELNWLCREVAGSGDPSDADAAYQPSYLKDDMSIACGSGEHDRVKALSICVWVAYALVAPAALATVIARHKAATDRRWQAQAQPGGGGGERVLDDYWHSATPLVERFWFPLIEGLLSLSLPQSRL
jgi:hypothetical protein